MVRIDGSAALKLDFDGTAPALRHRRGGLRLASSRVVRGAAKYREFEHRRRQAQIKARHLLDLMEGE